MAYFDDDDYYPVSRITAGAVGEPGHRVFILQARIEGQTVSWIIEKKQAAVLSRSIPRLLDKVRADYPELGEPLVAAKPKLDLDEPLEPVFRVGDIAIDYDRIHDLVVLTLADADLNESDEELLADPEDESEDEEPIPDLQIFTTRGQALLLGRQAEIAVSAGRPECPNCGEPIDDFGHFCLPPAVRRKSNSEYMQ